MRTPMVWLLLHNWLASTAGMSELEFGGNAFDAACDRRANWGCKATRQGADRTSEAESPKVIIPP